MTTEELVKINEGILDNIIKGALTSALLSSAPFLFAPIVKEFTNLFIDWISKTIVSSVSIRAYYLHTDIRVSNQGKRYSAIKLKMLEMEKKGDLEGLKNAQIELEKCFIEFVSFKR